MIKIMYSIRDVKAGWTQPVADLNDETAKRGFAHSVQNSNDMLGFSPADFALYKVGEFNTETGLVSAYPVPVIVMEAVAAFQKGGAE